MGAPGCDDAPVIKVLVGLTPMRHVTMVYPYYENPNFLRKQIEGWGDITEVSVCSNVSVIIVDDGSPDHPAEKAIRGADYLPTFPVRLFRIEKDVRWNWLAARNIGAHHAQDDWLLLTDMDHVVLEDVLHALIFGRHDPGIIYRFSRVEHTGKVIHPHPNSWFMTREMYWKVGGYDEALSGFYGTDGEYRRRCAATAPIRILTDALVRHEYVGDSSTTHYKRKQPEDAAKKKAIAARGKDWKPKVLSFPYHEVKL